MISHKANLKTIFVIILLGIISFSILPKSSAATFEAFTDNQVYTDGKPLFVYGNASPDETIIIRLFAPDGTIANFDQIEVSEDGSFNHVLLTWPQSSITFPYGTYTVEVISTQNGISKLIDVQFTSTTELVEVPVERQINTLVFAPETAAINHPFRIFVQTTSDGMLVGGDPRELLATSHVHLPNGEVQTLTSEFRILHPGLYFVDYTATFEGTYVFHVVTFTQGSTSHGSAATNVLKQDISGISEQILKLNSILDKTSSELDILESRIEKFDSTLKSASTDIESNVASMSTSVTNIEEASVQLNSLFFPIVGSIGVIVALQIVILARRR
jgi:hypothetical protein